MSTEVRFWYRCWYCIIERLGIAEREKLYWYRREQEKIGMEAVEIEDEE